MQRLLGLLVSLGCACSTTEARDAGVCTYTTKKYGERSCPVSDGAKDFCGPQDDCNLNCYCWSDLTVHCTSDSCRLQDGGDCCRHDW